MDVMVIRPVDTPIDPCRGTGGCVEVESLDSAGRGEISAGDDREGAAERIRGKTFDPL